MAILRQLEFANVAICIWIILATLLTIIIQILRLNMTKEIQRASGLRPIKLVTFDVELKKTLIWFSLQAFLYCVCYTNFCEKLWKIRQNVYTNNTKYLCFHKIFRENNFICEYEWDWECVRVSWFFKKTKLKKGLQSQSRLWVTTKMIYCFAFS